MFNKMVDVRQRAVYANQIIDVLVQQRQDKLTKLVDAASVFMDLVEAEC